MERIPIGDFFPNARQSAREYFLETGISLTSDEIFQKYQMHYAAVVKEGILPNVYPDALEVFKELKKRGVSLALISSHPEQFLVDEARSYGIFDSFGIIRGSTKDKALGIAEAAAGFGFLPGEAFYIGDTIYDIRSARNANTRAISITTGYHSKEQLVEEKPDFIINNLSELLAA
jgi:phosphoglycolate phosphatase